MGSNELSDAFEQLSKIVKKSFNSIKEYYELNFEKEAEQENILALVKEFSKAYSLFYEGGDISQYVTQQFWYRLYLQRNRLQQLGMSLDLHMEMSCGDDDSIRWDFDGKNLFADVYRYMLVERTFFFKGQKIETVKNNWYMSFGVVQSAHDERGYVCPNCGGFQSKESLIDGCDYCNTKFKINDFYDKISSMKFIPAFSNKKNFLLAGIDPHAGFTTRHMGSYSKDNKVKEYDPAFSTQDFLSALENKLEMIHYAKGMNEVGMFSMIDLSGVIMHYRNVVECCIDDYFINDFFVDQFNQVIKIELLVYVLRAFSNDINKEYETIHMTMVKDKNHKTNTSNDVTAYLCKNCGNSINLMSGGVCESCGTRIQMRYFDWIIGDYRVVK